MNASSREKCDFWAKEERDQHPDRLSLVPSSSRRWSAFRNPRIVRVSRALGGKDRHSKVCTVRGLRDRRIRLSVPTAVQLYDLQDKLGVSQPSKVIDWLIDATKHEIDKLPPLQMPPGFGGFPLVSPDLLGASRSSLAPFFDAGSSTSTLLKHGLINPLFSSKNNININDNLEGEDMASRSKYWDVNDVMRAKGKEVESREFHLEKAKFDEPNIPARLNFLPLPSLSSHTISLSHQLGTQLGFMRQSDHQNHFTGDGSSNIASSLSLSSNIHHHNPSYFTTSTPIIFPPYNNAPTNPLVAESNFQLFSSGSMPPLHLFGSSTRPILGEYVKFLCQENKTENPPSI
ncbi:transcription factor TCP17 [Punica granatum]|uniref:TCP domain-containing protein n=2 Tax=Punica granatum TaxID=22663 RepID=A0A218Y0K6_PUNGR|nr:transcription factor TCP17 [Punica granatum]OWM90369.1 hypothetical protein CDL15_Pgr014671 [Punica granatum]PKI77932.1 hypothetical protein CRG98_001552 [Punica granatum]